jgi:hypothetical protein
MRKVIQPDLKRGRIADGAAILLLLVLLAVLFVAVLNGVQTLPS